MLNTDVAFEVGQWQTYELALLLTAGAIVLFWLGVSLFKRRGIGSWIVVLSLSSGLITLCFFSRTDAMVLQQILLQGQKIEVVNGELNYGEYHFPYMAKHEIDYREIHLDKRTIKLYHSGHLPSARCYRGFYSHNLINANSSVRLYIHWFDSPYQYRQQDYILRAPCILKIEQLHDKARVAVASN